MGLGSACLSIVLALVQGPAIPLPEHPRPDFQRAQWLNLNGRWQFWFGQPDSGKREILVPFSWGSPLSGVPDSGDIGSYARDITVPETWRGRRVLSRAYDPMSPLSGTPERGDPHENGTRISRLPLS